jgi:hypothetical protein
MRHGLALGLLKRALLFRRACIDARSLFTELTSRTPSAQLTSTRGERVDFDPPGIRWLKTRCERSNNPEMGHHDQRFLGKAPRELPGDDANPLGEFLARLASPGTNREVTRFKGDQLNLIIRCDFGTSLPRPLTDIEFSKTRVGFHWQAERGSEDRSGFSCSGKITHEDSRPRTIGLHKHRFCEFFRLPDPLLRQAGIGMPLPSPSDVPRRLPVTDEQKLRPRRSHFSFCGHSEPPASG